MDTCCFFRDSRTDYSVPSSRNELADGVRNASTEKRNADES